MSTSSWEDARKSYLTSLRSKLKAFYKSEAESGFSPDKRWLNGFMAAGFHSGLVGLKELKLENASAYKKMVGKRMTQAQERRLESRLTKLCKTV